MSDAVQVYYLANRQLPPSLDDLTKKDPKTNEPYIDKIPLDPWKHAYVYKIENVTRHEYTLTSAGPDGAFGTEDDIVYPPREK